MRTQGYASVYMPPAEQWLVETWDTADATQNAIFYPTNTARLRIDSLAALRGGLVTDTSLRARVSAIVGPGATMRGIAQLILPLYTTAATRSHPAPTVDELLKGLMVYNQFYLPTKTMNHFQDGLRIPLPIEIDRTNGDWVLNANAMRLWARSFKTAWQPLVDQRPARLPQPDPAALAGTVQTFLNNNPTALARGIHLGALIMSNPFRHVFFFFEAMRQLAAAAFEVVLVLMDNAVNHQMQLLATLTAGNALLRNIEMILANPPRNITSRQQQSLSRAIPMLNRALRPGGSSAIPRELPETPQQLANRPGNLGWQVIQANDPTGGRHRIVLGRDVLAGSINVSIINGHRYRGPAYGGRISPTQFIAANANLLNPTNNVQLAARLQIVQAIAVNEGFLDAVRLRDRGIVSSGMQQWSAHVDIELPSLLARYKQMAPDEFMLFFGIYGLDVRPDGHDGHGNPRFKLQEVQAGGARVDLNRWRDRRNFFGGSTVGNTTTFRTHWAARFREPPIASMKYRIAQLLQAAARFDRVLREVGNITVGGNPVALNTLITSQLGAALILDAHINMPARVRGDLQRAANLAGHQPDANALDQAITRNYARIRHTHNTPARNRNINRHRPALDVNHGTFNGW